MIERFPDEADPAERPEVAVERAEVLRLLHHCLQELPLLDQEVFVMRAVRESSYEEITQTLNLPLGTVASKYFRVKEKLKRCLEGKGISFGIP